MGASTLFRLWLAASAAVGLVLVMAVPAAHGATPPCRVRNVTQDTAGRSLIRMVRRAADGDRLRVRGTCKGEVVIRRDITIEGVGDRPIITGEGAHRGVVIHCETKVTLDNLIIKRGRAAFPGGAGIFNAGNLTVRGSKVRGNRSDELGGGISNLSPDRCSQPVLTLVDTVVWGNRSDTHGGGIFDGGGYVTLIDSSIRGNASGSDGGGMGLEDFGKVTLTNSVVAGNSARRWGGGIDNEAELSLSASRVSHNTAGRRGGGIYNRMSLLLDEASTVTGNSPDDCVGTPAC
jgi:hypothetical protein